MQISGKKVRSDGLVYQIIPNLNDYLVSICIWVNFGSGDGGLWKNSEALVNIPSGAAHFIEHIVHNNILNNPLLKSGYECFAYTNLSGTYYKFICNKNNYIDVMRAFCEAILIEDCRPVLENIKSSVINELLQRESNYRIKGLHELRKMLYENHAVSNEVVGSIQSIHGITNEEILSIKDYFYVPDLISVCMVGNIDYEKMEFFLENEFLINRNKFTLKRHKIGTSYENNNDKISEIPSNYLTSIIGVKQDFKYSSPIKNILIKNTIELLFEVITDEIAIKSGYKINEFNYTFGRDFNFFYCIVNQKINLEKVTEILDCAKDILNSRDREFYDNCKDKMKKRISRRSRNNVDLAQLVAWLLNNKIDYGTYLHLIDVVNPGIVANLLQSIRLEGNVAVVNYTQKYD